MVKNRADCSRNLTILQERFQRFPVLKRDNSYIILSLLSFMWTLIHRDPPKTLVGKKG